VETKAVRVDSIHDLPRIIKVIGTVSRKGEHTEERPHRMSRPLGDMTREEDAALRERITTPIATADTAKPRSNAKPRAEEQAAARQQEPTAALPTPAAAKARRTESGLLDFQQPVEMCPPFRQLWENGTQDRSLGIFDLVRFFMHKGLGLDEITQLVVQYDGRTGRKLDGRDAGEFVGSCWDKVAASRQADGSIAPPCHSLQQLGFCQINSNPKVKCALYDRAFDIEKAVQAIPKDCPRKELEDRLRPILENISFRNAAMHGSYLSLLQDRFGLKSNDLRRALKQARAAVGRNREPEEDTGPGAISGEIYEGDGHYFTIVSYGDSEHKQIISSFAINPTLRIRTENDELIQGRATTDSGRVIDELTLPRQAFLSRRDLLKHLPSADLQWTGSDNNVQGLQRCLARQKVPTVPGTSMLGDYHKGDHHLWICPRGAISKDGFVKDSPVRYVPSGSSLGSRVSYVQASDAEFQAVADVVFRCLPKVNLPEVVLPMIGWFFASPLKPQFVKHIGSFPTLFVHGTQGSGKSSLCMDVFWPLFGVASSEPYSATETEFALLKILSSSRSIPVFIDEYKPYDMPKYRLNTLHRYIRRLYRGDSEERGRPDQTVNSYYLQVPLCVAGETRPTEAALLERVITANPDKTTLDTHSECREAFAELKSMDLSLFAPRYIQFCLAQEDLPLRFDRALATTRGLHLKDRKAPLRVQHNLATMIAGLQLFEDFSAQCGHQQPIDMGVPDAIEANLEHLIETDFGVKNALDHFLEMLSVMAIQGELRYQVHYVIREDILYVHLESAYDAFRKHCRAIGYEGEMADLKALRRMIRENHKQGGFVVDPTARVYYAPSANRRSGVAIDLEQVPDITLDDFPRAFAA
jgi:hypothetical protein